MGGRDDSDSDETVVEGSVTESDVEEEEFRRRRLLFLEEDVALTTGVGINEGAPSPEICYIQKFFDHTYNQKEEQIKDTEMVAQEACTSDQSQSLLQGWINFPSLPENISKPGFALNAAVEGQQNNSVDINLNGVQKDSEEKMGSLLDFPVHLLPVVQGSALDEAGVDCAKENSDALPVQPVTALNALSASVVPNERQFNTEGEQLNSEPGIPQSDGDCTQITNMIEPQLATIKVEEIEALTGSNLQGQQMSNPCFNCILPVACNISFFLSQPVVGQQREKEAISDYCIATSSEKQTEEARSHSVEAAACAETAQTRSRTAMQLRETPSRKCRDHVSSHCQILDETQQAKSHSGITTGNKAKDFDKIQKSTSKDKKNLETNICQEVTLNENRKVDQRRRSKRIENKHRQEALPRNSVNPVCPISLSTVNRRDTYGRDDSKNMSNTQSVEDTNPHQISLQTDESEPACADSTDISQQTIAASYSSSIKTRLSSTSQSSQASEQQTPKKSVLDDKLKGNLGKANFPEGRRSLKESSLSTRKEAVILRDAYNTRGRRKIKIKRNEKGETQLHIAAKRGDLSLVKTLISSGICVNEQDYAGWTAIHEASNRGFTEVILELLKAGADVNSRNMDGVLPIHDAVSGNYLEAARILLQYGANPCERSDSGESALDVACDDEMKELLKSYSATDSTLPVETIEVTKRHPSRSRRSKRHVCNYYKNDDAGLEPQHENYSVESVDAIQDAEEKQKELFLLELRTSKDADVYIQRLSQMQNTLNEMLATQKTERDTLAKKYRASVESFKKGALRKQLVHLASRQRHLLAIAQTQEKLVQKIQNYRRTQQVFSASCSEKEISHSVISCGNDKRRSLTADESMCPDVVTFNMGLGASVPNRNAVEAHLSLENRFSAQECSQHPHTCLDKTEANKEAIRSKEGSDHALASESRVREYHFDNMSMLTNAVEVVTLPSEPTVSTAKTKCSWQKEIDCVAIVEEGIKSLNPTSVTYTLNTAEPRSAVVNNRVCQPGSDYQQVLADEPLHRYVDKKEAFQQQVVLSTSTKNFPNTPQQVIFWSSENSFNADSVLTDLASNTDYPVKLSEKPSQSYSNQECEQNKVRRGRSRKKLQLIDLLELGRIKPGEDVLEFKLQEFSHKATLLKNGKIRTSKRRILENPVQWIKDLLGSDISVTWKYVWNKVTYRGTQLSNFLFEEMPVSSDLELPSQEREPLRKNFITRNPSNHNQHHQSPGTVSIAQPCGSSDPSNVQPKTPSLPQTEVVKTLLCSGREAAITEAFKSSSVQFNSMESLTHFLQFREIVMVRKEEFLPCSVMEKHWSFYKGCEDFGF
ncbi:PREDICTED: putative ankyrin repeat domain-containing protein 31 [Calidris pugnax]|uniref:putative ankyrin repeat domain-containing protein 31 n=1 Tax=Calidris pugnax TaxID=198806 RepID=UPI00071C6242|nr:PREDICTED: putative ankyrin repeat domain-containing protein 31 [Calidris pugnax]